MRAALLGIPKLAQVLVESPLLCRTAEMAVSLYHDPWSDFGRAAKSLSRRTWRDQAEYEKLLLRVNAKSVHQLEREVAEEERKDKEERQRVAAKEAAAQAKLEAIEARRQILEEERSKVLLRRKHRKRAAKKAAKKQTKTEDDDDVDAEASEELLFQIEKELEEIGKFNDECFENSGYSEPDEIETPSKKEINGESNTKSNRKSMKESIVLEELENGMLDVRPKLKEKEEQEERRLIEEIKRRARESIIKTELRDLTGKVRKGEEESATAVKKAFGALKASLQLEDESYKAAVEANKAEAVARKAADEARKASEKAASIKSQAKAAAKEVERLQVLADFAKESEAAAKEDLDKFKKTLKAKIQQTEGGGGGESPLVDFLTESIRSKSGELECRRCFEESRVPIYSCLRGHLLCSFCRWLLKHPVIPQCLSFLVFS